MLVVRKPIEMQERSINLVEKGIHRRQVESGRQENKLKDSDTG